MIVAKKETPPPAVTVEVDEHWLRCWVAFGFKEMDAYLARRAAFDAYCTTHHRKDTT